MALLATKGTRGASQQGQLVAAEQLAAIWREAVTERPGLIAAIKVSPEAEHHRMIDVLDQLQLAGARRISLQLLEP